MARLLNWGDKTIFRYENGSIQDKAHNSMLKKKKNPENMKQYIIENEVGLDDRHRDKLLNTIDMLLGTVSADNIAHIEIEFDSGYEKHKVVPDINIQTGVLSDNEIKVLDRIYEKFDGYSLADISNYSHKENGYIYKTGRDYIIQICERYSDKLIMYSVLWNFQSHSNIICKPPVLGGVLRKRYYRSLGSITLFFP